MRSSRPDAVSDGDAYWFETGIGVCSSDEAESLFMFLWKIEEDGKAYYQDKFGEWEQDGSFPYDDHRKWLDHKAEEALLNDEEE